MIIVCRYADREISGAGARVRRAIDMQVSANRIRVQNTLTQTGASKYTLTSTISRTSPKGEATPLNEVLLQMPGVALTRTRRFMSAVSIWGFSTR